ncbi:hypothetical protein AB0L71_16015 [Streptomyces sp. NPDC052052]|uniref:hypothetical protein n=1 Tax=Streptomyces sp. NPDC052052 TaxID=3154756 RepID=UPI003414EF03
MIVCDPGFYEPREADDCWRFGYFCQTHDRPYRHESCGEGAHLVALHCYEHGPENMWPQPEMLLFPEGFDPLLSDTQLVWVQARWDDAQ